jgi:hypothetical protein
MSGTLGKSPSIELLVTVLIGFCPFFSSANSSSPLDRFLESAATEPKRNHNLCYAYDDGSPGLPCNPAFLGLRRPDHFWIYAYGNNNLEYFQNVSDIVDGPIKSEELLPIIDHNSDEHFQLGGSVGYVADNWGFSFTPEKLLLFTHIRNPALPRITLLVSREQEAQIQLGSFWDQEWAWGLELRGSHRRFSYSDAYLSDHFTDDADNLYTTLSHYSYYLEPSLIFAPETTSWNPIASFMVKNVGHTDKTIQPYNLDPIFHLGLAISENFDYGHLQLGLTSQWIKRDFEDKIYSGFGFTYELSEVAVFSTITELEQQFGLGFNGRYFTTAISYADQDWSQVPGIEAKSIWRWDVGFQF